MKGGYRSRSPIPRNLRLTGCRGAMYRVKCLLEVAASIEKHYPKDDVVTVVTGYGLGTLCEVWDEGNDGEYGEHRTTSYIDEFKLFL